MCLPDALKGVYPDGLARGEMPQLCHANLSVTQGAIHGNFASLRPANSAPSATGTNDVDTRNRVVSYLADAVHG
jgi:hypothetical protein